MQERKGDRSAYGMVLRRLGTAMLLLMGFAMAHGQSLPLPEGPVEAFLRVKDPNVEVGRPFRCELEVHHPSDIVVIFPDTSGDFAPYELIKRYPIPTRSDETGSIDFAEYELYSWAIDSLQELRLPVRYIQNGDTQLTFSNTENLLFVPRIVTPIDSLKVLAINDVAEVREPFPWGATLVLGIIGLIILTLAFLFLLPKIIRRIRRRMIDKEWERYHKQLREVPSLLPNQEDYLLQLSHLWKKYYDKSWRKGLVSLSTRELKDELPRLEQLEKADCETLLELNQRTDIVVYAGQALPEQQLSDFLQNVKRIMEIEYNRRRRAIEL